MKSIREIANEQGWTDRTLLELIIDWADSTVGTGRLLVLHLQSIADTENSPAHSICGPLGPEDSCDE